MLPAAAVHFGEEKRINSRQACLQAQSVVNSSATMNKVTAFLLLVSVVAAVRVTQAATVDVASKESLETEKEEKGFFKSLLDRIWSSNEQKASSPAPVSNEEEPVLSERLIHEDGDEDTEMIVDQFLMDDILNLDPNGNPVNSSNFSIERVYEVRSLPLQSDQ